MSEMKNGLILRNVKEKGLGLDHRYGNDRES